MSRPSIDYDFYRARARVERAKAFAAVWRGAARILRHAAGNITARLTTPPRTCSQVR